MRQQQGSTLIMVLIVLIILLISSLTLVRSTESSTLIAGNIAFKKAASLAAEVGIGEAVTTLGNMTNFEANAVGSYFATAQVLDQNGIPNVVNWGQVPSKQVDKYNVQYIIERLCSGTLPVVDKNLNCVVEPKQTLGSKKLGSPIFKSNKIFYRVTVRVSGPRNTLSFQQAILSQ